MRKIFYLGWIAMLFISCTRFQADKYSYIEGFTQGTTYHITFLNKKQKDYSKQIQGLLDSFAMSLSIYNPQSIIGRVNNNEDVSVDQFFTVVFNKAQEVARESSGAFDITVGPLVNAWGFGIAPKMKVDSSEIDSLRKLVGYQKVKLVNGKVVKDMPGIKLDDNALAPGYSVDLVSQLFESEDIRNYLVEIGGEVRARGRNPKGQIWNVGIDKPEEGNNVPGSDLQSIVRLKNKAVATSGNYRKFYEENGVKYSHHIDPSTGYPAHQNLLSASVMADDCITADAWGTAFMVLGLEKSKELLRKHPELNVYFVYSDSLGRYRVWSTGGFQKWIEE